MTREARGSQLASAVAVAEVAEMDVAEDSSWPLRGEVEAAATVRRDVVGSRSCRTPPAKKLGYPPAYAEPARVLRVTSRSQERLRRRC